MSAAADATATATAAAAAVLCCYCRYRSLTLQGAPLAPMPRPLSCLVPPPAPPLAAGRHEDIQGDYSELLSSSIFCLVVPGDGWSARMDDATLHGCIPVIIMVGGWLTGWLVVWVGGWVGGRRCECRSHGQRGLRGSSILFSNSLSTPSDPPSLPRSLHLCRTTLM